tara:strand:+ start:45 stop:1007 length:963 start_codon:yes stop_codon:yes gene_type:complete
MLFSSFFICILLCIIFIYLSQYFNFLDLPDERKAHKKPTPKIGGLSLAITYFIFNQNNLIAIPLLILFLLITLDDFFNLNRFFRLFVQVLIPIPLLLNIYPQNLSLIIFLIFGIIIFVAFINLFNFFDGLNTLLISQFILILGYYLINIQSNNLIEFKTEIISLIGASFGFLIFNILGLSFLGDIGSCLIGFYLAFILISGTLINEFELKKIMFIAVPLIPILTDTSLIIFIRFLKGEKFFSTPHKQHAYQIISRFGFKHWQVSIIYVLKTFLYIFILFLLNLYEASINYYFLAVTFFIFLDVFSILIIRKKALRKNILI